MEVQLTPKQEALQRLRNAVDEGDEDLEAGRYSDYTDESSPQLLEELKREARAARNVDADISP
jgi:hypothetical protein